MPYWPSCVPPSSMQCDPHFNTSSSSCAELPSPRLCLSLELCSSKLLSAPRPSPLGRMTGTSGLTTLQQFVHTQVDTHTARSRDIKRSSKTNSIYTFEFVFTEFKMCVKHSAIQQSMCKDRGMSESTSVCISLLPTKYKQVVQAATVIVIGSTLCTPFIAAHAWTDWQLNLQ